MCFFYLFRLPHYLRVNTCNCLQTERDWILISHFTVSTMIEKKNQIWDFREVREDIVDSCTPPPHTHTHTIPFPLPSLSSPLAQRKRWFFILFYQIHTIYRFGMLVEVGSTSSETDPLILCLHWNWIYRWTTGRCNKMANPHVRLEGRAGRKKKKRFKVNSFAAKMFCLAFEYKKIALPMSLYTGLHLTGEQLFCTPTALM